MVIDARAPLEKMFGYSTAVRSLSQGRASYTHGAARIRRRPRQPARKPGRGLSRGPASSARVPSSSLTAPCCPGHGLGSGRIPEQGRRHHVQHHPEDNSSAPWHFSPRGLSRTWTSTGLVLEGEDQDLRHSGHGPSGSRAELHPGEGDQRRRPPWHRRGLRQPRGGREGGDVALRPESSGKDPLGIDVLWTGLGNAYRRLAAGIRELVCGVEDGLGTCGEDLGVGHNDVAGGQLRERVWDATRRGPGAHADALGCAADRGNSSPPPPSPQVRLPPERHPAPMRVIGRTACSQPPS